MFDPIRCKKIDYSFDKDEFLSGETSTPFGIFLEGNEEYEQNEEVAGEILSEDAYVFISINEARKLMNFLKKHLEELD